MNGFSIEELYKLLDKTDSKLDFWIRCDDVGKYDENEIHQMFSGMDSFHTPFNSEFAKFFMLYFKENPDFMVYNDEKTNEQINLLSASHNRFAEVQKIYPNKRVIIGDDRSRLTPEVVIDVLKAVKYENVQKDAEQLAVEVGLRGYSQSEFEELQDWYFTGMSIPKEKITLKIAKDELRLDKKDENESVITYELLEKSDPISAVLGDITNCCQVVNGAGSACVKYGMTQPNSGFLVFRYNGEIIGQAWVWYDENSKQLTLDNIEVPKSVEDKIKKSKTLQNEFINAILRVKSGFEKEMGKDKVKRVTIGARYNDINSVLSNTFNTLVSSKLIILANYTGYTDANERQYMIDGRSFE